MTACFAHKKRGPEAPFISDAMYQHSLAAVPLPAAQDL